MAEVERAEEKVEGEEGREVTGACSRKRHSNMPPGLRSIVLQGLVDHWKDFRCE